MKTFFIDAKFDLKMFWIKCKKKLFAKLRSIFFLFFFCARKWNFGQKKNESRWKMRRLWLKFFFFFWKKNFSFDQCRGGPSPICQTQFAWKYCQSYIEQFFEVWHFQKNCISFWSKKQRMRSISISIRPKTLF